MKVIVLGSGTSVPMPRRASPSIAVFFNDNPLLLDIGPGTLRQLSRIGISHEKIDQIIISHFHPDHTADLVHFLFVTHIPRIKDRRKKFRISGPEGLKNLIMGMRKVYKGLLEIPPDMIEIEEYKINGPDKKNYGNYSISSMPVSHTPNSLAYLIKDKDETGLVYSGDTDFSDDIVSFAKGSDFLILECSMPEGEEIEGHLTPSQAGRVADLAGVKRLMLIHFYPEVLATDITRGCRKYYKGELILARDMMQVFI